MKIVHPSELRSLRLSAGLTQKELAEEAGVTQAYIAKIESGQADPKVSTLEKISEALRNVDINDKISAELVMTEPIISVSSGDKVKEAIKLMETNDISQMPVIDSGRQVGSLAEDTIIHKISSDENIFGLADESVEEIMEEPFPTVGRKTDIETIFYLIQNDQAVLVLEGGSPVGIITKADILQLSRKTEKRG